MIEPYLGAIAIAVGVPLVFFGLKLVKYAICFAGFITVTACSCLLFYTIYFTDTTKTDAFWYFLAGGALAGLIVGLLLAKFVRIGAAILAGWGGFCAGLLLNATVLFRFELSWLFWTSNIACIIIAAVLAFFLYEHAMILATAALGSYGIARGVSVYLGHYYNEFTIIELLKAGAITSIDHWYWCYVGGMLVFFIVGSVI